MSAWWRAGDAGPAFDVGDGVGGASGDGEFRTMLERLPDSVTRYGRDGRLIYLNPAAERAGGVPIAVRLGTRPTELVPTSPRAREWETLLQDVFASGRERSTEWERRDPDGTSRWLHVQLVPEPDRSGVVTTVLVIGRDITPLKRAQQEIQRRAAYFRVLIENATDMVAILSGDGTVRYLSPSVTRILGYPPDGAVGRSALASVHRDDQDAVRRALAQAVSDPGATPRLTYRFRHADGSWRMIESLASNVLADPTVGGLVINSRDVTERSKLEEQLRQAQKLEAIGRLAGGVAHDFNNLLTVILGNSDFLKAELGPTDPRRAEIEEIQHAADRASGLTRQLLAFSRRQIVQPRPLEPRVVVTDLGKMLRRLIGENIELTLSHAEEADSVVMIDPGQLEQVIFNLCVNARDAMPAGGRLTIATDVADLGVADAARAGVTGEGRFATLTVTDTGVGMPPDVQARIFEPFFTTKDRGTGLGLATVYGIAKQAGGHVTVASEPGHGTTFVVYLPTVASQAPEAPAAAPDAPLGTETVLLVEDDAPVRATARRILEGRGYRVLEAASGSAALEVAGRGAEPIHLLMTDVVMPGMSGPEVVERMRALRPGIRVLYASGYTDDAIARYGVLAPGVLLLEKPFTMEGVARKVREALDTVA